MYITYVRTYRLTDRETDIHVCKIPSPTYIECPQKPWWIRMKSHHWDHGLGDLELPIFLLDDILSFFLETQHMQRCIARCSLGITGRCISHMAWSSEISHVFPSPGDVKLCEKLAKNPKGSIAAVAEPADPDTCCHPDGTIVQYYDRSKFRSQTCDKMDTWQSRGGKSHRRE